MYDIGVLMFHTTQYGKADFNVSGVVEGLFNGLSKHFDKDDLRDGFFAEAKNYLHSEPNLALPATQENNYATILNEDYVEDLFAKVWNKYAG